MKKAMIIQPMKGISEQEIQETRQKAVEVAKTIGYEVVDTIFDEPPAELGLEGYQIGLYYLGKSIKAMATCDAVIECQGYSNMDNIGCFIESMVAGFYHREIIYMPGTKFIGEPEAIYKKTDGKYCLWDNAQQKFVYIC